MKLKEDLGQAWRGQRTCKGALLVPSVLKKAAQ